MTQKCIDDMFLHSFIFGFIKINLSPDFHHSLMMFSSIYCIIYITLSENKINISPDFDDFDEHGILPYMMKILRYIYFICKTLKIIQATKVIRLNINIKI